MDILEIPPLKQCAKYLPGHSVHPIQASLSYQDSGCWVNGTLRWIRAETGRFVVEKPDGEELPFYNHDLDRLVTIVETIGDPRVVVRGRGVLAIPDGAGSHFLFCVRSEDAGPLDPCIPPDPLRLMHEGSAVPIPRKSCRVIGKGHNGPSYSKRRWGDGRESERRGKVLALDGEMITIIWSDGELGQFRHHHPERFADLMRKCGTDVLIRNNILAVQHVHVDPDGRERVAHFLVSVAPDTGVPLDVCLPSGKTGVAGFGSFRRLESMLREKNKLITDATPPEVESAIPPNTEETPWVADLDGRGGSNECQSTVTFDDNPCDGKPECYVQLEVLEYEVANPLWEGKLCGACLAGWRAWAKEDPQAIHVLAVTPLAPG